MIPRSLSSTLAALSVMAVLGLASCGGSVSPAVTPTPTPSPGDSTHILVPAQATKAEIDASFAQARAQGPGTWVVFPAGAFAYRGTLVVPDAINMRGQGIWDQGESDGGGGTWLQTTIKWGSHSTISKLLMGRNLAGAWHSFTPCAKGDSACGPYTQAHGSTGCTFSQVRFKGGSDGGGSVFDVNNWGSGWSTATNPLKKRFLVDTTFVDCEFERPQAANSVGAGSTYPGGNPGMAMNLWYDARPGGAQISGNKWIRCHFGVKNGYHSGIDGYGIGTTILCQGAPSTYATTDPAARGFNMGGGTVITSTSGAKSEWNPNFDWSQVDHCPTDNSFTDCLFEYATWYPMDLVDFSRQYSMWHGVKTYLAAHPGGTCTDGNAAAGWGNPPGSKWVDIPAGKWIRGWNMTRCYMKGSYPTDHSVVGEVVSRSAFVDSFCGTGRVFNNVAKETSTGTFSYGNSVTGSFSGGHPDSPIFTRDWDGTKTSYTPSPYDP